MRARSWVSPLIAGAIVVVLTGCSSAAVSPTQVAERAKVHAYVTSALDFMYEYGLYVKETSWAKTRQQTLARTRDDTTYQQAYGALMLAAWAAGGPKHSAFRSPVGLTTLANEYGDGKTQPTGHMVASEVAEITLPRFWGSDPAHVQNYVDVGANLIRGLRPNTTCGWVVDLRKNYGGNMMPMLASVSALLTPGPLISFVDRKGQATWTSLTASTVT